MTIGKDGSVPAGRAPLVVGVILLAAELRGSDLISRRRRA